LTDEILDAFRESGLDAAEARYRELREQYYGRAAYDFGQGSLNMVTETLAREGDSDAALAMIALNIEHNPEEHWPHMLQAQVMAQSGDLDGAIASAEKALELDPGNEFYMQQIERLKTPPQR
jgi:tetratricopeptide (TPR) repeat protein